MIASVLVGTILGLITIWILVAEHYSAKLQGQTLRLRIGVLQLKINQIEASNKVMSDQLVKQMQEDWL